MKKTTLLCAIVASFSMTANAQFWDYSEPAKLKGTINTVESEESIPVFSKDSSILYFVRTFDKANKGDANDQDVWMSIRQDDGSYSESKRIKALNNKFNNAVVGLSINGSSMYLFNAYDGKKDQTKGIAFSKNNGGGWSKPEPMVIDGLDIDGDFYGFHVNEQENVIIISYEGPGTKGKEDLYVSTKSGGKWSAPVHMGSAINSAGYEISPFLSKSQDTLFFSSNGFGGEGDADIFYSVKQGGWSDWSKPINLGSRINSPKFDAYFSYSGNYGYWSSNRGEERSDIYMIEIFTPPPLVLECSAVAATIYKGSDGSVDLVVTSGAPPYSYSWSNGSNSEDALALVTGDYTVTVTDAAGQVSTSTCFVDQPPMPIDPVVVLDYENYKFKHNFGYNKNKLSVSRGDLRRFVRSIEKDFKKGRAMVTIKIISSASQVPTKTFGTNKKLADVRAENMKYDLMNHFKKKYADKINIVVVNTLVDGPAYEEDATNKSKYVPFQYVSLETE
ncbi:MAG: SprB repeat-containing protein [Crocinitomicaceae bacterium]|nr:SprB repeat-containing protein [Crocinitomicaceae bacterium]